MHENPDYGSLIMLLYVLLLSSVISCSRQDKPLEIEPPHTPVLTSESIWGIAKEPYLRIMKSPRSDDAMVGILRRGDRVEILSKVSNGGDGIFWTRIRLPGNSVTGWVVSGDIDVYDTKTQADTAHQLLYEN